jgi:DNA-binding NtrC family response regulator
MNNYLATILLVDEDPLQALTRKSLLEQQLGPVLRVNNAVEALCLMENPEQVAPLRLVISGHHMPGIGGPAFVAELQARFPLLPILVLGNIRDVAGNYSGDQVHFLPRSADANEILRLAAALIEQGLGPQA